MIIPYILSYGNIFNKPSYKIYIFSAIIILFLLTIYTGMYSEGLSYRDEYYNPGDPLSN